MIVPDWAGYLKFKSQFEDVLDPRFYTIEWLEKRLLSGDAHLIRCADAAIIYEIRPYPTGALELHGLIAAGDMESIIKDLIPAAEAAGRAAGCVTACIESRAGWARALKPYGYEVYQIAIKKEL